jgi:hypothetical protein
VPVKPSDLDLDDILLGPDDDEPPNRKKRKGQKDRPQQVGRLQPLPGQFVRVPIQWICQPRRGKYLYPPAVRLHLYLLHLSRWGQRGVPVTSAFRAEIKVSRKSTYQILKRIERQGWVRIERHAGHALVAWPVILAG